MDAVNREFWFAAAHRGGKPPRVGATVQTLDGLIEAIGAGLGVATTIPEVINAMGGSAGVVFRPVDGLEPLDFWVARRVGDDRGPILDFMDVAIDAQHPTSPGDTPQHSRRARASRRPRRHEPT